MRVLFGHEGTPPHTSFEGSDDEELYCRFILARMERVLECAPWLHDELSVFPAVAVPPAIQKTHAAPHPAFNAGGCPREPVECQGAVHASPTMAVVPTGYRSTARVTAACGVQCCTRGRHNALCTLAGIESWSPESLLEEEDWVRGMAARCPQCCNHHAGIVLKECGSKRPRYQYRGISFYSGLGAMDTAMTEVISTLCRQRLNVLSLSS
jgi:hypothetical protein